MENIKHTIDPKHIANVKKFLTDAKCMSHAFPRPPHPKCDACNTLVLVQALEEAELRLSTHGECAEHRIQARVGCRTCTLRQVIKDSEDKLKSYVAMKPMDAIGWRQQFEKMEEKFNVADAKLSQNKCNSGHETLPLFLWNCPRCVELMQEKINTLSKYVKLWIDGVDFKHDDDDCPMDDTCSCKNVKEINSALKK